MNNPFSVSDCIKTDLVAYIETAYATRFPSVNKERRELLERNAILMQDIYVEPILNYKATKSLNVNPTDSGPKPFPDSDTHLIVDNEISFSFN